MRQVKFRYQRLLACCLCVFLLAGSIPQTVFAFEKEPDIDVFGQPPSVSANDLGELEAPKEFPAKGTICVQIADSVSLTEDGKRDYHFREDYLPVLVTEDHRVYTELDTLAKKLNIGAIYDGSSCALSFHETRAYMQLGSTVGGYHTPLFNAEVQLNTAPFSYQDTWYVALDDFFRLTQILNWDGEENWLGKKEICMIPPQRTLMDDIGDFYQNAYSYYAFSYATDLGYTEEVAANKAGGAALIQYGNSLITLDPYVWHGLSFAFYSDELLNNYQKKFTDAFMEALLTENEQIRQAAAATVGVLDYAGAVLDTVSNLYQNDPFPRVMEETRMILASQNVATALVPYEHSAAYMKLNTASEVLSWINILAGFTFSWLNYGNVDQQTLESAQTFYKEQKRLKSRAVLPHQYEDVEDMLFFSDLPLALGGVERYFQENWTEVLLTAGSAVGWAAAKEAAGIKAVWKLLTNSPVLADVGNAIDSSESFLIGAFGIPYETDAIGAARAALDSHLRDPDMLELILSESEEERLRQLFYHAAKACLVTRAYGCHSCSELLEKYPALEKEQAAKSQKLAAMAGRLQNPLIPFGTMPSTFISALQRDRDYFPNVLFNFCKLQGQVLRWENEKPAKDVKVEVYNEEGNLLTEFQTDKEGRFEKEFALEEMNVWDKEPAIQDLTLHLYDKKNPVVLQPLPVKYFHEYEVEGLHVGRMLQRVVAYVTGAQEQNGKDIIFLRRVTFDTSIYEGTDSPLPIWPEDAVWEIDAPDGQGGSYTAYACLPGTLKIDDIAKAFELEEGAELVSVYGRLMPEDSLVRGLVLMAESMTGEESAPSALTKPALTNAQEVQAFVEAYYQLNGQYPTFSFLAENSVICSAEPVMIVADESEILRP